MAIVMIQGVYMGANLHKTKWDGNERTTVLIDVYQPESPLKNKALQVKSDELQVLNQLNSTYKVGDVIQLQCSVSAYKNDPVYKLVSA